MTQTNNADWTDEYIRPDPDNPGKFIVYDYKGEFVAYAKDRHEATKKVIDYAMRINGFKL